MHAYHCSEIATSMQHSMTATEQDTAQIGFLAMRPPSPIRRASAPGCTACAWARADHSRWGQGESQISPATRACCGTAQPLAPHWLWRQACPRHPPERAEQPGLQLHTNDLLEEYSCHRPCSPASRRHQAANKVMSRHAGAPAAGRWPAKSCA